jgi:hypothetical protein
MASQYVVSYRKIQHHQGQIHQPIVVVVGFPNDYKAQPIDHHESTIIFQL